jgi:hypothetical protein
LRPRRKKDKNLKKLRNKKRKMHSRQVQLGKESPENGKKLSQHHSYHKNKSLLCALIHLVKIEGLLMTKNDLLYKQQSNSRRLGKNLKAKNLFKIEMLE